MKRSRFTEDQVIRLLKEHEAGCSVARKERLINAFGFAEVAVGALV